MQSEKEEKFLAALGRIEARLAVLNEMERTLARLEKSLSLPKERPEAEPGETVRLPGGGNEEETWLDLPEDQVAAVLAPFANAQRVKLLKALYMGISESGQLKEFTGLTGGQLYHHLKELALAKFLSRKVRGEYRLSSFGYYAFSALMILVASLLEEEMEEEVVTPEEIEVY